MVPATQTPQNLPLMVPATQTPQNFLEQTQPQQLHLQSQPLMVPATQTFQQTSKSMVPATQMGLLVSGGPPPTNIAQHLMDAQRGKTTAEVPASDGLRTPATIASIWAPLYPHLWVGSPVPEQREREYREAVATLQAWLGVVFTNPYKRDRYVQIVDNVVAMVGRRRPMDRLGWRPLFSNTADLLVELLSVQHGAKAVEGISKKFAAAFTAGYIDFEEIARAVEVSAVDASSETTTIKVLQSQIATLQNQNQNQNSFRRGRGRGGGGRGRGRGRGG
jgi:hypothetical protein